MQTNAYKLLSLIRLSAESAREELDKIPCRYLEEHLPESKFNPLFDQICTVDETLKTIQECVGELMDGEPKKKPPLDVDFVFNPDFIQGLPSKRYRDYAIFRLFHGLYETVAKWRIKQ